MQPCLILSTVLCCLCVQYLSECSRRGVSDVSALQLHSGWYGRSLSTYERAQLSASMPMDTYRVYRACDELVERSACVRCWLQRHCCICDLLPALPPDVLSPNRVVLLLHHLEFGRASNTGKLLLRSTTGASSGNSSDRQQPPAGSRVQWTSDSPLSSPLLSSSPSFSANGVMMLVAGIPAHDAKLAELCAADKEGLRTFVLFPSSEATTVQRHVQRAQTAAAKAASQQPTAESSSTAMAQTIIVMDGTYSQARQLVRRIPQHIPRVKLEQCQRTDQQYRQYVQTVQQRMGRRRGEEEKKEGGDGEQELSDEEDEQRDVHRRGKQWNGADISTAAAKSTSSKSVEPLPEPPDTVPSFLSSSFFSAVRKQPQGDRVSTIEAIAFCLHAIKLHSLPPHPQLQQQPSSQLFPASLFDSLLLLVDALRLQAGLYQQYRTHSRQRRRDIKAARLLLYPQDEQRERDSGESSAAAAAENSRKLCRPFNKLQGCSKQQCEYEHRCGQCGDKHHSFVLCPQRTDVDKSALSSSSLPALAEK